MKRLVWRLLAVLLAFGWLVQPAPPAQAEVKKASFGSPQIDKVTGKVPILKDVEIVNFGKVVHKGKVDVNPTLERVRDGKKLSHPNDGSIFQNREKKLPKHPDGYYREFVIPTSGVKFPGPQRLVIGKGGEVFYTGDHYHSFHRVN